MVVPILKDPTEVGGILTKCYTTNFKPFFFYNFCQLLRVGIAPPLILGHLVKWLQSQKTVSGIKPSIIKVKSETCILTKNETNLCGESFDHAYT